ncbi:MAG: helix-turn-helix domain-containing protein [Patescibacteria group bacterium]|jgi:cytoskeletal protein RodZ|nr:helix-turn-helix domain-containing protein [Patescibacteria group bacterium]MDD3777815.1 helix-turn-helix domain-containing protein [Patescibacteria group bacterium]MDD3939484.1 helix-turn-helix domain-containing protein [Patescibacteria group bacterium]MDD4443561.1 helix-turn-helix domain-containing protein [Patescibacteria group bacterium]NCU39742.1 hypothetical protein [Candidatus Falkowbacteria bacterium]
MNTFVSKKILPDFSLGEELRQARNEKKLNIDEVASAIQIRKDYLLNLESENFNCLPSGLYCKSFLKRYATFLEIDKKRIDLYIAQLENEFEKDDPFAQKVIKKKEFLVFPKIIKNILLILVFSIFILYLSFYFRNLVTSPDLEITNPTQNIMTSENQITLSGITDPGAEININKELILTDRNGAFSHDISLKKGLNNIEIVAKKKYSRENVVIRQILVE